MIRNGFQNESLKLYIMLQKSTQITKYILHGIAITKNWQLMFAKQANAVFSCCDFLVLEVRERKKWPKAKKIYPCKTEMSAYFKSAAHCLPFLLA